MRVIFNLSDIDWQGCPVSLLVVIHCISIHVMVVPVAHRGAAPVINTLLAGRATLLCLLIVIRGHAGTISRLVVVLYLLIDLRRVVGRRGWRGVVSGVGCPSPNHFIAAAALSLRNFTQWPSTVLLLKVQTIDFPHLVPAADQLRAVCGPGEVQNQVSGHHVGLKARLVIRFGGSVGRQTTCPATAIVVGKRGIIVFSICRCTKGII